MLRRPLPPRSFRVESEESLSRLKSWGFIVPAESSLGSQTLSLRATSPSFSIGSTQRLNHRTTSAPRGLMGYDHRPQTEYLYDVPGAMARQLESHRPSSPEFGFSEWVALLPFSPPLHSLLLSCKSSRMEGAGVTRASHANTQWWCA